jgi:hypothetical protein
MGLNGMVSGVKMRSPGIMRNLTIMPAKVAEATQQERSNGEYQSENETAQKQTA